MTPMRCQSGRNSPLFVFLPLLAGILCTTGLEGGGRRFRTTVRPQQRTSGFRVRLGRRHQPAASPSPFSVRHGIEPHHRYGCVRQGPLLLKSKRRGFNTQAHADANADGAEESNQGRSQDLAKGQVITSYSEVIKVLVQLETLSDAAWGERRHQLEAARLVALKAGEIDDAESLKELLEQPKEGNLEFHCVIRKVLKKAKVKILVGDQVRLSSLDWVQTSAMVVDVMDRQLELAEPKVANVDLALLVFALVTPDPSVELMTRFTVSLAKAGIPFCIIMNKADMVGEDTCREWEERISSWGHDVQCVSVKTSEGLDTLRAVLKDKVTVLCGPSGVGKSSIINWMLSNDCGDVDAGGVDVLKDVLGQGGRGRARGRSQDGLVKNEQLQSVQSVSSRSGSGKQTTRTVSLLRLPGGGLLADTPGFSKATLQNVKSTDLSSCFPEIQRALDKSPCKFSNCKHLNEPGCSVGDEWERYSQYVDLLSELEDEEEEMRKKGKYRTAGESVEKSKDSTKGRRMEFKFKSKRYRKENRRTARQNLGDEFL